MPTASCLGAVQGGASAPVGSIMFGKSTKDKECSLIRLANEFIGMGNFDAAAKVLCATKSAKEAKLTIDECRLTVKPQSVVSQNINTSQQVPMIRDTQTTVVVPVTVQPVLPVLHTEITVYAPKPVVKKPVQKTDCHIVHKTVDVTQRVCKIGEK